MLGLKSAFYIFVFWVFLFVFFLLLLFFLLEHFIGSHFDLFIVFFNITLYMACIVAVLSIKSTGIIILGVLVKYRKFISLYVPLPSHIYITVNLNIYLQKWRINLDSAVPSTSSIKHNLEDSRREGKPVELTHVFPYRVLPSCCFKISYFIIPFLFRNFPLVMLIV